jgi:hypothetical protein
MQHLKALPSIVGTSLFMLWLGQPTLPADAAEYAVAKKVCEDIDAKKTRAKSDYRTRNLYSL